MAVAAAGPYANHLHLTPDRQPRQHLITQVFTGQMLFLTPNPQCQNSAKMKCDNLSMTVSVLLFYHYYKTAHQAQIQHTRPGSFKTETKTALLGETETLVFTGVQVGFGAALGNGRCGRQSE